MIVRPGWVKWVNNRMRRWFPGREPYLFAINYRRAVDDPPVEKTWLHMGVFAHNVPRPVLRCRRGHRPVVDGIPGRRDSGGYLSPATLWVRCARCGTCPPLQGRLDPGQWRIGQPYDGPWRTPTPPPPTELAVPTPRPPGDRPWLYPPGPFPQQLAGKAGCEVIVGGKAWLGAGFEVKVGGEHTLAGSVRMAPLAAVFFHTDRLGETAARLANRRHTTRSRRLGVYLRGWRLGWHLWTVCDEVAADPTPAPWWRHHEIDLRIDNHLLGPKLYHRTDVGARRQETVHLPDGEYPVELQLVLEVHRRRRQLRPKPGTWLVRWISCGGIPIREQDPREPVSPVGAQVPVDEEAVYRGTWTGQAAAAIAEQVDGWRQIHRQQVPR